jgi:hypothetical protein
MVCSRRDLARLARVGIAGALACSIAFAAAADPASPGVRSTNPAITALMREAVQRSRTFRQLIERVAQTDGIVYVEHGRCGHSVRACLLLSVTTTPEFRLLRVVIDTTFLKPLADAAELIGSLGHELRHALEVLTDKAITTDAGMYAFYAREFPTSRATFETKAAIDAGNQVRKELTGGTRKMDWF